MGSARGEAQQAQLRLLLEAAVNGDRRALGELVRETQPLIWQVCTALGSPGEVEDLVQETYLRAMRSLRSYRGDAPVTSWLLSIARHVCADHVRGRTRRTRLIDRLRAQWAQWAQDTAGHGGKAAVAELVRTLDRDRREAFVLTQMCGLSYAETAEVLDCPVGTVRSRVARARADLLDLVQQSEAL